MRSTKPRSSSRESSSGLDVQLALGRLEPGRVLEREVAVEDRRGRTSARTRSPGPRPAPRRTSRPAPARPRAAPPRRAAACRAARSGVRSAAGQVEEVLEHLVHHRAAHRVGRGRLGQLVDGAEAVEQRAGQEVAGPARGERAEHVDAVDGRRQRLGGGLLLHAHARTLGDAADSAPRRCRGARGPSDSLETCPNALPVPARAALAPTTTGAPAARARHVQGRHDRRQRRPGPSSWFLVAGLIAVMMAPRVEQVSPGPRRSASTSPGSPSRSCSTSRCCCTRPRTP